MDALHRLGAAAVADAVEVRLADRSAADWLDLAVRNGLPVSVVRSVDEAAADMRGVAVPLPDGTELRCGLPWSDSLATPPSRPAPRLGQHTDDVLSTLDRG